MTQIAFAGDVIADYDEAEVSFIVVTSMDNYFCWDRLESAVCVIEQELADGAWAESDRDDPFIGSWRAAYRSFGLNPNRTRPSVDALRRRVGRDRQLPRINPAVDAYNLVSLRHGLPAGAFDLDTVDGNIIIRRARAGELFRGIGSDEEMVREGEIVYSDASRVLTRGWNYRDCDHTKVTTSTRTVLFIVERISRIVPREVLDNALDELISLVSGHADVAARATLDRHNPIALLQER